MNTGGISVISVKNWTSAQCRGSVYSIMKRKLRIQVAFEPTRMGKEHLQQAYEMVVPVRRRRVRAPESVSEPSETIQSIQQEQQEESGS